MRITGRWVLGGVVTAALALSLAPALGGEGGSLTFSLIGGEGAPGEDAGVTLQLDNDDGSAVSAGVDIVFSDADLTFTEPVADSCELDASIASTHQLAGRIVSPGVVNVEILVSGTPDPLPTLGNGPLAVCDFTIRGDAMDGDMFPVEATNVFIGDDLGMEIPSNDVDGVISVVAGTPTATPTNTEAVETPTATATQAEATATATPTIGCGDDSDCPTGLSCQEGTCRPIDCTDDEDCPPGSTCVLPLDGGAGGGQLGMCVPDSCDTDDDCPDRSSCVDNMCRPDFCDDNNDCDPGDVCASDGICSMNCDDDSQCDGGVCEDGTCVECRDDGDCDGSQICVDNACTDPISEFSLTLSPDTQSGVPGGSAAIEVVLSHETMSAVADSLSNTLTADAGLSIEACSVAAEIPGTIDGTPGSVATASLGDGEGSVPTGTVYSCDIAIGAEASGTLDITCTDAQVDGLSVGCGGASIEVVPPPTPTSTPTATMPFTPTHTPTEIPTVPPTSGDDDGCAVGPVSPSSTGNSLLLLVVPAILLWSRRRSS